MWQTCPDRLEASDSLLAVRMGNKSASSRHLAHLLTDHVVDGVRVPAEPEGLSRVEVPGLLPRGAEGPDEDRPVPGGGRQLPVAGGAVRGGARGEADRGHAVVEAAEAVEEGRVRHGLDWRASRRRKKKVFVLLYFFCLQKNFKSISVARRSADEGQRGCVEKWRRNLRQTKSYELKFTGQKSISYGFL